MTVPSEEQITRLTNAIGAETEIFRAFATSTPAVDIVSICLADLIFVDFKSINTGIMTS
jgi:hypothetical protein